MRRGAVLDLLVRPMIIIQVAVFGPISVILLFVAAALRPGTAVAASSVVCAGFGLFVGQGIRVAAGCAFAWTLPAFRRALLLEFVAGGLALSGLATAILLIGGAGTDQAVPVFAAGFASFSVGAVSLLGPQSTQLLVLAFMLVVPRFAFGRTAATAILGAPLATVAIAGAVSALVLWTTFSRGAFRWSALTGPRQDGQSFWQRWGMSARWRNRRNRQMRPESPATAPARYVGYAAAGGVLANYRAVRPVTWLFLPFVFLLCLAVFRADVFDGGRVNPFTGGWFILAFVWWTSASWSRRSACQAMLPWSRRHHAIVAYVRDLGDALLFLLLMLAAASLVLGLEGMRGPVLRGLAVMAIFFPAARWLSGPPVGDRWKASVFTLVLAIVGIATFLVALNLLATHLPALVSSGAWQGIVLGALVLLSQALHWRSLHRYLTTRDLVGDLT
jgi:hypothetical protein